MEKTILFLICVLVINSIGEITLKSKSYYNNQWKSDSDYVGASIEVIDSTKDVIVTYRSNHITRALGELFFINPSNDSVIFLFHNFHNRYPEENTTINLGKFSSGSLLTFMYTVTDTSKEWAEMYKKKIFTGQNRVNTDKFISERESYKFGKRWAAAGKIDGQKVEIGFSDCYDMAFNNLIFEVSNADIDLKN